MQKPSIGRIVHFQLPHATCAAIVTYVWTDTMVNLAVFPPDGTAGVTSMTSIEFGSGTRQWTWPPRV